MCERDIVTTQHRNLMATIRLTKEFSFEAAPAARSGSRISKRILLGGLGTPADYLLSFCKMFGLVMAFDGMERKVTIMQRGTFFRDSVTDASGRIDLSREVEIEPFAFAAKYYDFALEGSGGAFEERYLADYGREYGMQRVNTGYGFDADNVEVLSGLSFRAAATVLEYGKYWNVITLPSGGAVPSVFLETGNTYTLYDNEGNSEDYTVPCPPYDAVVRYYNGRYRGYDIQGAAKPQFHDAEGKPCGGEGVLLYLSGFARYESFKLSDDSGAMAVLNEGEACWDLTPGGGLTVPVFSGFSGGIASIFGPTGGFLWGFLIGMLAATTVKELLPAQLPLLARTLVADAVLLLISYVCGTFQLMVIGSMDVAAALLVAVVPFVIPDVVKLVVGAQVGCAVARAAGRVSQQA